MKRAVILLPLGLTFALSACQWNRNAPSLGRDFGNTTSHNISRHIMHPDPVHAGYGAPALDGERATSAVDRYRRGGDLAPEAESIRGGGQ